MLVLYFVLAPRLVLFSFRKWTNLFCSFLTTQYRFQIHSFSRRKNAAYPRHFQSEKKLVNFSFCNWSFVGKFSYRSLYTLLLVVLTGVVMYAKLPEMRFLCVCDHDMSRTILEKRSLYSFPFFLQASFEVTWGVDTIGNLEAA